MADSNQRTVLTQFIASHVRDRRGKPHIDPSVQAYHVHHAKTVGAGSDEW
jgi:hypothetical protein